jgi:hypothetical protein
MHGRVEDALFTDSGNTDFLPVMEDTECNHGGLSLGFSGLPATWK